MKICTKCKSSEVTIPKSSWCRNCKLKYQKEHYWKHRESNLEKGRQYKLKNRVKILEYKKRDRDSHKEQIKEYRKAWRLKNKEHVKKYKDAYFIKFMKNPSNKLSNILRGRIKRAISKNYKESSCLKYLGCSVQDVRQHLESLFQPGMTWENHGTHGWHIDHKIPICSFDLTKELELKKAFHFTNLQPLWAKDNLLKGSKLIDAQNLPERGSSKVKGNYSRLESSS